MAELGYDFSPDSEEGLKKRLNQNGGGYGGPLANEAIRILSLRLPTVLGGKPITPDALLRARPGAAGAPGAVAETQQRQGAAPLAAPPPSPSLTGVGGPPPASSPMSSLSFGGGGGNESSQLASLLSDALGRQGPPIFSPADPGAPPPSPTTRATVSASDQIPAPTAPAPSSPPPLQSVPRPRQQDTELAALFDVLNSLFR